MNTTAQEREHLRAALRGQRLPTLAIALDVPVTTLEMFINGRALLTPELMNAIAAIVRRQQNIPAPIPRNGMRLTSRALKCTLMLTPAELAALPDPGSSSRVVLEIAVGAQSYNVDIAAKSLRKTKATISENGPDNVACFIQGRLDGSTIVEAGLVAQVKQPK